VASQGRLGRARRWLADRFDARADGGGAPVGNEPAEGVSAPTEPRPRVNGPAPGKGGSTELIQPAAATGPPQSTGESTGGAKPAAATRTTPPAARVRHPAGVPWSLRAASEWAWRFLVIALAVILALYLLVRLRLIVFPVIVALFITALLAPAVNRLQDNGMRRGVATALVFVGSLLLLIGLAVLLGRIFANGVGDITDNVQQAVDDTKEWLAKPPFRLDDRDLHNIGDNIRESLQQNRSQIFSGAVGTATVVGEVITGLLLTLFTTFFFLYDGQRIWRWITSLFPRRAIPHVMESGRRAWTTLTGYVRGTILIALVDGFCIGLLLLILRVPLAIPLGVFVFFGAFVPLVGATVTGAVAVLVALVTKGVVTALLVLAGIIGVQQLEGHVLQPFLLGRFVRVHPLAVVLGITAGAVLAGIGGAIIAVPLIAIANTVGKYFVEIAREATEAAEEEEETGGTVAGSGPGP
jgi:putative heme transporter